MFVDEATIEVKGGDGGDGTVAFRREKYMPYGGPSGGDGGKGGDVILKVHPHVKTLLDFSRHRHYKGDRGRHGEGGRRKGIDGDDMSLNVPIGTQVFDTNSGALLADLLVPGQTFVAAQGGMGGRGNTRFVSSSRQAPRFSEKGTKAEVRLLKLTLKVLADVALIGLPNAGKSTLIAAISAARPKIADYPFTTLVPNLGAVQLDTETQFVVADIPGLIRGAHKGAGLGHQFLKHIERAPVFVHLLDATQTQELAGRASLWRNFMSLNRELKMWNAELLQRPQLIAINKMDALSADDEALTTVAQLKAKLEARGCEVFEISAATNQGLQPLLWRVFALVKEAREAQAPVVVPPPLQVTRVMVDKPFTLKEIARYADGMSEWEAAGGALQRLIERFDMENYEAVLHLHRLLEHHGVLAQLREAGVKHGDLVHVGKAAFAFEE